MNEGGLFAAHIDELGRFGEPDGAGGVYPRLRSVFTPPLVDLRVTLSPAQSEPVKTSMVAPGPCHLYKKANLDKFNSMSIHRWPRSFIREPQN